MKFPEQPERNNKDIWYGVGLAVGAIIFLPLLVFFAAAIKAFVISTLWSWYVVQFFHVAELPLPIAFGISLMINFIVGSKENYKDSTTSEKISVMLIVPVVVLFFGWIGTFFI